MRIFVYDVSSDQVLYAGKFTLGGGPEANYCLLLPPPASEINAK